MNDSKFVEILSNLEKLERIVPEWGAWDKFVENVRENLTSEKEALVYFNTILPDMVENWDRHNMAYSYIDSYFKYATTGVYNWPD